MIRAPLSSVNGPEATSCPASRRLARYWRWTGRTSAIFVLSWLYSMMAANFMARCSSTLAFAVRQGQPADALGVEIPAGQHGVGPEEGSREEEVGPHRPGEERQARRVALHQAANRVRVGLGLPEPGAEVGDQEELQA